MVSAGVVAAKALQWLQATIGGSPANKHEAMALFVHAVLLQHGFRPATCTLSGSQSEEASPEQKMPEDWNSSGYGGKYKHHQSGLNFELRMVPLGQRLRATATVIEQDDKTYDADFRADTYVRDDAPIQSENFQWDGVFKNVEEFASLVQLNLGYKLVPDSAKTVAGETTADNTGTSSSTAARARPQPQAPNPDPLMIGRPQRPNPYYAEPVPPFADVGGDDLLPSGLYRDGLRPHAPGFQGGPGSLVGPNHPMFARRPQPDGGIGGPRLPRGAVPPGARFDPFGPPNIDPSQFGPDNDHDQPPPDMYW
mmetsp:Transcript_5971/g.17989  ORF Transcript_5971/g.17989 Transcript_5971/m.17989 type:complete len:309 (-) Transcript_5971:122-1048(-)|eukprot:CAMPEP_0198726368 /NCGR_PEP_ID=MMETSP1475-20131203/3430_1 /TAXON_ID= ORGANISM="Unidentified sp., Strain CCMP1999" /NCGR_SAMPLE_ID=MMETSP1475 /ASSEMBLY_ACC=CAM_ASM_001111 /LENGTH=308 /DNA_ID=CAMNT_0044488275 /DNA_START=142 /DNA_END=1065 /DNA_ORIENTATION=-